MTAIDQHTKCIKVLEMISDCDLMLEEAAYYFARFSASERIPNVEKGYKSDLARYRAIKDRLTNYYYNLIKKLSHEAN